jgi:hypothetical protein
MGLDPKIWGPHYWFFLHTVAICYPHRPNTITKKKYYDFIHNIPMFIPVENIASYFSQLLDQYPVSPYLDSRDAFIRWMHFIHNKINQKLEKPSKESETPSEEKKRLKPSDLSGIFSGEDAKKFHDYLYKTRKKWDRNFY